MISAGILQPCCPEEHTFRILSIPTVRALSAIKEKVFGNILSAVIFSISTVSTIPIEERGNGSQASWKQKKEKKVEKSIPRT